MNKYYDDFTIKSNGTWNRTIMLRYLDTHKGLQLQENIQNVLKQQQYDFIHYLCNYFGIKDLININ
jgi:hypothetical protein